MLDIIEIGHVDKTSTREGIKSHSTVVLRNSILQRRHVNILPLGIPSTSMDDILGPETASTS